MDHQWGAVAHLAPPPWLRLCHKLPKIRNFDCEYLENGKLQGTCQMGRNIIIGWTIAFQKCIAWDGSPQGVPYKEKYIFVRDRYDISRVDRRGNLHDDRALSRTWVSPLLVAISLWVSNYGGQMVFRQFVFF